MRISINSVEQIEKKLGVEAGGDAQMFVASESLRLSAPMIPLRDGYLIASGAIEDGGRAVSWSTPYARRVYNSPQVGRGTGAERGGFWFERMKAKYGDAILRGVKTILRGQK